MLPGIMSFNLLTNNCLNSESSSGSSVTQRGKENKILSYLFSKQSVVRTIYTECLISLQMILH